MTKFALKIGQWLTQLTRRLRNNFYLYLASVFSVLVLLDATALHIGQNMKDKAFDFVVSHRLFSPSPDPDIVIVDINEASLAAMAKEYGRWPWPRQVFGEFVENLSAQQPNAIVFDILFSDADVYNPDSDQYFNEVIANTRNTYFPLLRLPEEQDRLSQVKLRQLPGILGAPEQTPDPEATVAVVLPHFDAALNSKRLGTHNIEADTDGVARQYTLYRDIQGWRLPALPLIVGQAGNATVEGLPKDMLINWRGKPFTYHYVTFSDVYRDFTSQHKKRAQDEFKNKIVIIGSTAPSLFDLKATPMDKMFPGVEILATAIDNVEHHDYLRVLGGPMAYSLLSLTLLWLTTAAYFLNADREKLNKIFSLSQMVLLLASYLGIQFFRTYFDLTGPITWAILYFSIAKLYAVATDRALQRWLATGVKPGETGANVMLMPILIEAEESLTDGMLKKITRQIELASQLPNSVDMLKTTQSGIWGLFGDMIIVSWTYGQDETYQKQVVLDAQQLSEKIPTLLSSVGLPNNTPVRYTHYEGTLSAELDTAGQWRALFAKAILQLELRA